MRDTSLGDMAEYQNEQGEMMDQIEPRPWREYPKPCRGQRVQVRKMVKRIRARLAECNIETVVHAEAKGSLSTYIKISQERVGSIRISDHEERDRYAYRWQLRYDITEKRVDRSKSHPRYFYPPSEWREMCDHIDLYARIKRGER